LLVSLLISGFAYQWMLNCGHQWFEISLVKGFPKIILKSDSSLEIDLIIKNKIIINKNYNLIMQARELLAKK